MKILPQGDKIPQPAFPFLQKLYVHLRRCVCLLPFPPDRPTEMPASSPHSINHLSKEVEPLHLQAFTPKLQTEHEVHSCALWEQQSRPCVLKMLHSGKCCNRQQRVKGGYFLHKAKDAGSHLWVTMTYA